MRTCLFIALCAITVLSCNKYPSIPPGAPICQIYQIRQGIFEEDSFRIAYNHQGNPISITRGGIISTGYPNYAFHYDKKGRMSDYYSPYTGGPYFEIWHSYVYDNKNRIVVDSTYTFGRVGTDMPLPLHDGGELELQHVSTYNYDNKDRIIKATDTHSPKFTEIYTYTYNSAGNVSQLITQKQGTTTTQTFTYDNKVNFRQLHPIWQFLDRDYSVNNSLQVDAYNEYGLPIIANINSNGNGSGHFAAIIPLNNVVITYNCR